MANTNKQWKAEDIEKIWNNTGNGAQAKSAPLPVLNSKSQSSNSYKIKPYENKEYTAQDIEKVWRNVERGKQMQSEMKSKATSAPAKNTKVPTREESLKSKYDAVKNIDTRNVDRKTEANIKKITKAVNPNDRVSNNMQNNAKNTKPSTRYSNQTAGQVKAKPERKSAYDNDFNNFYEWRFNRADTTDYNAMTDTNEPHWLKVKEEIMKKNGWSDREFESRWNEYNKMRTQQMADEEVSKSVQFAKDHPVLGTLAQALYNPQTALEGGVTALQGLTSRLNPQELPTSSDDPQFTGTRAKEAMLQSVMDNIDSELGKKVYGGATSIGDMVLNQMLGGGKPAGMGLVTGSQSAARNQMRALERGADADTAAQFGTAAGTVTGLMNSIGLDKAMGAAAKTAKGAVAKGAATEGLENLVEDAANLTLDAFINKDKSQLNSLHDYYVSQNMSDEDAWKNVMKDTGLDLLTSTLSGAMFGGLVRGAKNLPELTSEIKGDIGNIAGKVRSLPMLNKITDENVNNNIKVEAQPEEFTNEAVKMATEENTQNVANASENPVAESDEVIQEAAPVNSESTPAQEVPTETPATNNGQPTYESENQRLTDFLSKKGSGSIEMSNGNVIEHYSRKFMNTILKEAKQNGEMYQDDSVTIRYKNGDVVTYVGGDDTSNMKLTDIDGIIYSNAETDAYAGNGVIGYNDYDSNMGETFEDGIWRLDFSEDGNVPETEITNSTEAPMPEAPQSSINPEDYVVRKIRVRGEERYQIMKDLHDDNPLERASEFGNLVYKTEKGARRAIQKYIENENAKTEQSLEDGRAATNDVQNDVEPAETENPVETNNETSNPYENDPEYNEYLDRRRALQESQQGKSIKEMIDSLNELKAMDAETEKVHPEWFENGRFIGNKNSLNLNVQFFAELSEEKKQLQAQLSKKGLALSQKRELNDQINEIDEHLNGLRKTITNTAVNAGIVTREQIDNDPELKAIAEYVRHSNAKTVEQAQQNLSNNGEQIKNDYVSGKTQIKTDLDADQAMLLLTNQENPLDDYERNSILKNLATNGTEAGQFIQALKKYSNTMQGALISATKVINDETEHWAKNHKKSVGINGKLAEALKRQGYDGTIDITKPKPTFDELRRQVANTLAEEYSSIENQFTDGDIDYLAHMLEHNVSIEDLVDALNTKMATGRFGISDETQAEINRLFEEAKNYDENSQDYVERQAEAFRLLAEEVAPSATPLEKFDAWRYMAMLGNPKTMLRNFIGNKMFGAVTGVADNFAALVEGGVDKASKAVLGKYNGGIQRTKAVLNPVKDRALLDATLKDAYSKRFRQIEGSKYEKMDKDALRSKRSVFDSKLMRLAEKAVDRGISDTKAVAKKYSTSMAGYMKANGITEQDLKDSYEFDRLNRSKSLLSKGELARLEDLRDTANKVDKARDYALKQAEYATFHEDNAIADVLSKASRSGMAGRVLVEGLIPFKKTPANIVKSGVEFSPLGAVKSIAQTGKLIYENTGSRKGNLDDTYSVRNPLTHAYKDVNKTLASDVIQSWARTLTGSGLASLGYYLYSKGILHSSTEDEKYQDDLEGKQNYSIEINGKTYSIDWAVPAAMPILLGAEVKKAFDNNAILGEKWYKSPDKMFSTLSALFEPVVETSMLQGVENSLSQLTNRFDDSSKFEKAANVGASLGANYLTQSIPTLSGQIARTVDNTRRATDTNTEGLLIPSLEKQGRKVLNKIPFASRLNNPYVNARGEQQDNAPYSNPLARLAYQTLSPAYVQQIDERDSDRIAREAYNGIGEDGKPIRNADVYADWKSNVKLNGEKFDVDQMYQYRTAAGQANTEAREALADADWFNNASPEIRTEVLRGLNTMSDHIGKTAVNPQYGSQNEYYEAYEEGGTPALLETIKADIEKKQQKKKLDNAGLPSNDVTKALIDNNNTAGQQKYKDALAVAKNYGYDSITKEEYQIFDKKGGVALSNQLKYKKEAEALDVPNSEEFRKAVSNGTAKAYAQTYKAIKSTKVGEDDLGNNKYLEYNDTTAKIYKDKNQQGLNEYVLVKKNMPEGSSKDSDYITALKKTSIPESDKAYFFVLHKGKDIAKNAPKGDENIYMWYQAKDKFDSNKNGSLSKEEKAALYRNVYNYLRSLGYSDSQAKAAQKWTWK